MLAESVCLECGRPFAYQHTPDRTHNGLYCSWNCKNLAFNKRGFYGADGFVAKAYCRNCGTYLQASEIYIKNGCTRHLKCNMQVRVRPPPSRSKHNRNYRQKTCSPHNIKP